MKILFNKVLVLIAIGITSTACTDEISDEVKNSENLSAEQQEIAKYANKSIRLVSDADEDLSHILHKAGSMDEACEIEAPALGFDSINYDKTSSAYTTDCVLDAQEFDLYFHGADLKLHVDEFLCEYVEYKPYRFFQYQPGKTSRGQIQVSCDETCEGQLPTVCGAKFKTLAIGATIPANASLTLLDLSTLTYALDPTDPDFANLLTDRIMDTAPLTCKFDYSEDEPIAGPNCDEGSIFTSSVVIRSTEVDTSSCTGEDNPPQTTEVACLADNGTWNASTEFTCTDYTDSTTQPTFQWDLNATSEIECGGKYSACLASPSPTPLPEDKTSFIYQNTDSGSFEQSYKLNSPYDSNYFTNISVANFSRICSSTSNTKTDAQFDTILNTLVGHEVEDMPLRTSFPSYSVDENGNGRADFEIKGEHMFRGAAYFSDPSRNVQPYYAFNCLDQARDVKAQIRLFVREWDRTFTQDNSYIARISDVNQGTPLMDAIGNQAAGEAWNDLADVDDLYKGAFTDNQCVGLDYGVCFMDLPAHVTEADCLANSGTWYLQSCARYETIYTDQATCEFNSGEWRVAGHCSDTAHLNQNACEDANETWFSSDFYFPKSGL